jgi:hypothetical protein
MKGFIYNNYMSGSMRCKQSGKGSCPAKVCPDQNEPIRAKMILMMMTKIVIMFTAMRNTGLGCNNCFDNDDFLCVILAILLALVVSVR